MTHNGIPSKDWHPEIRRLLYLTSPAFVESGLDQLDIHPVYATPSEVENLTRFCQEEEPKF